ncbi:MAG: Hsp20/alpha crystallin family protein [Planctomycetota bacterium]
MKLIPWRTSNRTSPIDSLFDSIFDLTPWGVSTPTTQRERMAPMNIYENETALVIEVELPGVDEKDVDVKLNGEELTVTAERKHNVATKDGDFHRVESQFGRFSRSLRLPDGLQTEAIDASFKRGVLTLTVPKAPERTPTKIHVKSS